MIDLKPHILSHLLATPSVAGELPPYFDKRRIFTRRPAPADGGDELYPVVLVSASIDETNADMVSSVRRYVTHYLSVYGLATDNESVRRVERIADAISAVYNRVEYHPSPAGWSIVETVSSLPTTAPTDDDKLAGRLVSVRFLVCQRS